MNPQWHQEPAKNPVSSIMNRKFAVVRDDIDVESLTRFLLERRLTCAAVSDQHGKLVGYVSMIDLVRDRFINGETENSTRTRRRIERTFNGEFRSGFHLESVPRATAGEIMMPFVLRLPESAPIDQAAALMANEGVHRIVVVSDSNQAVGIVSALDILRWLAARDGYVVPQSQEPAGWRAACEYATA